MSEPIAEFRDSAGVDRTAMFDPRVLLLLGLVGAEQVGLHVKNGALLVRVFLPRGRLAAPNLWNQT